MLPVPRADGRLLRGASRGGPAVRICALISSYRDAGPMGSGLAPMTSFFLRKELGSK